MIWSPPSSTSAPPLEVYLLGLVDFEEVQQLQRRLVYDLGDRGGASLVLCEHPPTISVGRSGSRLHIAADDAELRELGIKVHWVNRGGGCVLHLPGQLAAYFALPLAPPALNLQGYLDGLHVALLRVLDEFDLRGTRRPGSAGVFLGGARVATVGVAVNRWIAYHGLTVNVGPFLAPLELIAEPGVGPGDAPLRQTSMEARRQRPAPMPRVREALIRQLETVFALERHHVYTDHPLIRRKVRAHVYAQSWDERPLLPVVEREDGVAPRRRLPDWLKRPMPAAGGTYFTKGLIGELGLETICESARCPNRSECWTRRTATFMILGAVCTRPCGFCAVPRGHPETVALDEPDRLAEACARLGLRHVVITSVTRDDLADGGAEHFRRSILAVRCRTGATVEVLTPDFDGNTAAIDCVLSAAPEVFNHNLETVARLQQYVRRKSQYAVSLKVLEHARKGRPELRTKSGLMLGLGETTEEVIETLADLRAVGCDLVTLGQYLQPSPRHLPVVRYLPPEEFDELGRLARLLGFAQVASGPFVRSSYHADEMASGGFLLTVPGPPVRSILIGEFLRGPWGGAHATSGSGRAPSGVGEKKLVRYGSPDTAAKLAADAAAAEAKLGYHGVSAMLRNPPQMKQHSHSTRMLIDDWYDGPVGGVVTLDDARSFDFFLLDWDSEHRVRIFALQAISDAFDGMISQLTTEAPKWPIWFPSELVHPSDRSREWTSSVGALRYSPEVIDSVLIWDTKEERAIAIRALPPEVGSRALPWFDAIETAQGPFDWFRFLSINRG